MRGGNDNAEFQQSRNEPIRGSNPDEYAREARSLADNILDTMPGYSRTLEPRYDALSEPVHVQRGLGDPLAEPLAIGERARGVVARGTGE